MMFILLVIAPMLITALSNDLSAKRAILNEVSNFIDKVTDTGTISDEELEDFYLGCSSNGVIVDVKVHRYIRVVGADGSGGTYTSYVLSDSFDDFNQGDIVKVKVEALDYTGAQKLMLYFVKVFTPKLEIELAGMVR